VLNTGDYLKDMLEILFTSFQKEWGSGGVDTMFDEHLTTQTGMRHKGFRVAHMVGSFLDPRFKKLEVFGDGDKEKIKEEVFKQALLVAFEQDEANVLRRVAGAAAAAAVACRSSAVRSGRSAGSGMPGRHPGGKRARSCFRTSSGSLPRSAAGEGRA
jgi:hypothetical protein